MDPISLNTDPSYLETFSDSSNMLKYRFNHLAKFDLEAIYKGWSVGLSSRYSSYMHNIDALFEDGFQGQEVLPGLKEYRENNQRGNLVFDVRFAKEIEKKYRVSLIVNNLLNAEYSSRPGDIQAPRNFIIQLQYDL
jgi:iron complex outermembrane receptor protein